MTYAATVEDVFLAAYDAVTAQVVELPFAE
jgi:hypothetical protein